MANEQQAQFMRGQQATAAHPMGGLAGGYAGPGSAAGRSIPSSRLASSYTGPVKSEEARRQQQARYVASLQRPTTPVVPGMQQPGGLASNLPPGLYGPVSIGAAQPGYLPGGWVQGPDKAMWDAEVARGAIQSNRRAPRGVDMLFM